MTVKKRRSARNLRDRNRLSRYFHTHGYGRLAGGYAVKKDKNSARWKMIYIIIAVLILGIGMVFVIF